MVLDDLSALQKQAAENLKNIKFKDVELPQAFKDEFSQYAGELFSNDIIWDRHTARLVSKGSDHLLYLVPNIAFYYAAGLADFYSELEKYKKCFDAICQNLTAAETGLNAKDIPAVSAEVLRENGSKNQKLYNILLTKIGEYFVDNETNRRRFVSFVTDYGSWNGGKSKGKTIDRGDFAASPILQTAELVNASHGYILELVKLMSRHGDMPKKLPQLPIQTDEVQTCSEKNIFKEEIRLPKPFLILAGTSGTGKTRFVRWQAEETGRGSDAYCLTPVRPDWQDPAALLGYVTRLSGNARYVATDVLKFIASGWRQLVDAGLSLSEGKFGGVAVTGDRAQLDRIPPMWLCLDEMNLAPVEQYFADYLSVLETRKWQWEGDHFTYSCDPILKPAVIGEIDSKEDFRNDLGLNGEAYDELWEFFCNKGFGIPFNLVVAGTVNMDESTHGFSRKVLDRAMSLDFPEFFPNDYQSFFKATTNPRLMSYPLISQCRLEDLSPTADRNGELSQQFLESVRAVLSRTPFDVAYRVLNELYIAVASLRPTNDLELQAVWDDFLMYKILPRIEGDSDRLQTSDGPLLDRLEGVLESKLGAIWSGTDRRPDLLRKPVGGSVELKVSCRSKVKIEWMKNRLASTGFTCFWP